MGNFETAGAFSFVEAATVNKRWNWVSACNYLSFLPFCRTLVLALALSKGVGWSRSRYSTYGVPFSFPRLDWIFFIVVVLPLVLSAKRKRFIIISYHHCHLTQCLFSQV